MEKLELKHIAPYLPYGLKIKHESIDEDATEICNLESLSLDCITFDNGCDYYFEDSDYDNPIIKPLLRPLSDLYKEIDGIVGIVELAKISFDMGDNNPLVTEGAGVYDCRFDDKIFLFNSVGLYFSAYRSTDNMYWSHIACPNQLEMFTYLFQHHYDIFNLIGQNLAIDLNKK